MRYGICSDIHANLEALTEVFACFDREKVEQYVVLGDVINYGADPHEVLTRVRQRADVILAGNHEQALFLDELARDLTPWAYEALQWTKATLTASELREIRTFPLTHVTSCITFVHASPDNPTEFKYLFDVGSARDSFAALKTTFCFIGHTHVPQIFYEQQGVTSYLPPGEYRLESNERHIINVGSVGQPRDQDTRASCAIFDDQALTLKLIRLPYDNQKTAAKIRRAGLPHYLADRLL